MFVGGEFYVDERWLLDEPAIDTSGSLFLNGGKACLMVIGDYLVSEGIHEILLPSYLCPSILNALVPCGLSFAFYQVKPDLSIDLEDMARQAQGRRAVYFINYFGFNQAPEAQIALRDLQKKGMLVVEDNAQAAFHPQPFGDFAFSSLRKFYAHDGGYLTTKMDVSSIFTKYADLPNRRLPVIREYREKLADYLYQDLDIYDELKALYARAEELYDSDRVVLGDPLEQAEIERLNWAGIRQARRKNYAYLLEAIADSEALQPIFPQLQADNMPLGLPVYVKGVERDWLQDKLGEAGIGLTAHWAELAQDTRLNNNATAVRMANTMLTLVIDQRTSHKQMDFMVKAINDCLRKAEQTPK
jgi:dTDP-4-amino-4,6-dideoxygalactose transaminase